MTPEERTKQIEKLERMRQQGERQRQRRDDLIALWETRQKQYLQMLISKTRADGEPSTADVWKLVALDDLMNDMMSDIGVGRKAARKIEEMKQEEERND